MKFFCDEDVPKSLIVFLSSLQDCDTQSVFDLKLKGLPDEKVREIANKEDRILITFDKDFTLPLLVKGQTIILRFPRTKPKEIIPYLQICVDNLKTQKLNKHFVIKLSKEAVVCESGKTGQS